MGAAVISNILGPTGGTHEVFFQITFADSEFP